MTLSGRLLQQRIRSIERRSSRPAPLAENRIHFFENLSPITATMVAGDQAALGYLLLPIHNPTPMDLRVVTLISRKRASGPAGDVGYATAIYKAAWPKSAKASLEDTPGRYMLRRVTLVGKSTFSSTTDTARHHIMTKDIAIGMEPHFLVVQVSTAGVVELFAPARNATPHLAYQANEVGATFGDFLTELTPNQSTRQRLPYFVLRSAIGVRLYGDPVLG